jgi:hypothetical protein
MKYKYHSETKDETAWIESPNGGEVGDLMDITEELNLLQRKWIEKCMEADTLRQHLKTAQDVIDGKTSRNRKWGNRVGAHDFDQCEKMVSVSKSMANSQADRPQDSV